MADIQRNDRRTTMAPTNRPRQRSKENNTSSNVAHQRRRNSRQASGSKPQHGSNHSGRRNHIKNGKLSCHDHKPQPSEAHNTITTANANDNANANEPTEKSIMNLPWPDPTSHYVPRSEEERMLPVLIHWGKSERGMMKDQPGFRLKKILKVLNGHRNRGNDRNHHQRGNHRNSTRGNTKGNGDQSNDRQTSTTKDNEIINHINKNNNNTKINLLQSLSLRRHHLKLLNPTYSMPTLRLGSNLDIRTSADLFERCIEDHLQKYNVPFDNEEDQRRIHHHHHHASSNESNVKKLTPDFRIKNGHSVTLLLHDNINETTTNGTTTTTTKTTSSTTTTTATSRQHTIYWLEAKMFYGASTIPPSTNNAVGSILPKARQYVKYYGNGAMIFMYGCGETLARELMEIGVLALDCRGVDLEGVVRYQVGWCGDGEGGVLF